MDETPAGKPTRRPLSAVNVARVGIITYVLAALLNSTVLLETAQRMPLTSSMRGPAVWSAKQLHSVSKLVHLDRAQRRIDDIRGLRTASESSQGFGVASTTTTVAVPTTSGAVAASTPTVATTTTTTIPPTTLPKVPSQTTPLKLYIGGDSLVQGWGQTLQRLATGTRIVEAPVVDYRPATGLARPDSFDWPARLVQEMTKLRPQVAVVGFGGNDGQGLSIGSRTVQPGSPEWSAEYARRVGETMDYLSRDGRKVIWVGTPMPQHSKDYVNHDLINKVYRAEVAKRPTVTFIDTWVLFASPEGTYAAYLADDDGVAKLMRQGDGFHLSTPGAERLGRAVFAELRKELTARGAKL